MKRRKARELALTILYQSEIREKEFRSLLQDMWQLHPEITTDIKQFTELIVLGVDKHFAVIDEVLSNVAINWKLERMCCIDRNILRIAAFEILFSGDIPPVVAINEAIEISKIYGTDDSPQFVNGILNKIKEQSEQKR